jgi:hypothetical protein
MTNGGWMKKVDKIRSLVEILFIGNPIIPDDFFPIDCNVKVANPGDWHITMMPKGGNRWQTNGLICAGLKLDQDRNVVLFGEGQERLIQDMPNWRGLGKLRAFLVAAAIEAQNVQFQILKTSVSPNAKFKTRTREDFSAHELLEMQD